MLECAHYQLPREAMMTKLRNTWTPEQEAKFNSADRADKVLYLFGMKMGLNDIDGRSRLKRDAAVKVYMVEMEEYRTMGMGRPSLCGKAHHNDGLTLESALQWEQELYEDLEEAEEHEGT